jgi:hypothetical protein
MPTKQITVCTSCGKKTCDGSIWKMVSVIRKDTGEEAIDTVHPDNLIDCQLQYGVCRKKYLQNKKVGEQVTLPAFDNWVNKSIVTVEKIED